MMGGEKSKMFVTPSLGLEISKTESDKLPTSYGVNGGGVNVPPVMTSLVGEITKASQHYIDGGVSCDCGNVRYGHSVPST
jgi:hypothetical protein